MRRFPDKFTKSFDDNKHTVETLVQGTTVKIRNQIAGYITRTYAFSKSKEEPDENVAEGEQPD
jgi:small subunit ribosomal protein S17e